jgi:plasmid replication initiation protein
MKKVSSPVVISLSKANSLKKSKTSFKNSIIAMQHNNLVQAKYSMTLQQKRVMIWLVSQIQPHDIDFKEHVLTVRSLIEICNLSGESAYKEIKDITFSLIEKGIRIRDITNPKKDVETQVSWLSSAKYEDGEVKLTFSPELKPYLLQLKDRFTALKISDLMQFKSIHAIRIYELLKQYQSIGKRTLAIEEIKACCGVTEKLNNYSDFEKRILLIAQREINEKSDISFTFERKKSGRKITEIIFIISLNKTYDLQNNCKKQFIAEKNIIPSVVYTLRDFGLTKGVINKIMMKHSEEAIKNAITAVDKQIEKGCVRNVKAMLLTAINEHWHPEKYKNKEQL